MAMVQAPVMFRQFCASSYGLPRFSSFSPALGERLVVRCSSGSDSDSKQKVVFLGTPSVSGFSSFCVFPVDLGFYSWVSIGSLQCVEYWEFEDFNFAGSSPNLVRRAFLSALEVSGVVE